LKNYPQKEQICGAKSEEGTGDRVFIMPSLRAELAGPGVKRQKVRNV